MSKGLRNHNRLVIHRNENLEEVNDIDDWLKAHGWQHRDDGYWTIRVSDTLSIPTAPFGFVKSRVVTDTDTGHIVETFMAGSSTKPEQVHRNLEVYEKKGEAFQTWDEQDMISEDRTMYRALAARLNFLAVDRPDLLYAEKECSRRMSRLRNKDWEAIKRIFADTLSPARELSTHTGGKASRTPSRSTVTRTGLGVGSPGGRRQALASSTGTIS